METEKSIPKLKGKQKSPNHGGKREGAGRKEGTKNLITVQGLMDAVAARSNGKPYTELLVDDFLDARNRNDVNAVMKYHQLILQKVLSTTTRLEVTEDKDAIEAKKLAFAEALSKLTGMNNE